MSSSKTGVLIVALFAVIGMAFVPISVVADQPSTQSTDASTTVVLEPTNTTAGENETVSYEIVLTNASGGVGAFDNVTVSVGDSAVASITDMTSEAFSGVGNSGVTDNRSTAYLNVPFGGDTNDTGEVVLGTVTLQTEAVGETALNLSVTGDIAKESGQLYTVDEVTDSSLTVQDTSPTNVLTTGPKLATSGGNVTFDVMVTNASDGVGAFDDITFTIGNTSVATVTEVSTPSTLPGANTETTTDSAVVDIPFGGDTNQTSDVVVFTVTVATENPGVTDVSLNVTGDVADESGALYQVSSVQGQQFNVTEPPADLTGNGKTPTNTDNDGQLEDVNGNGELDIGDVQALFNARGMSAVKNNPDLFDFNDNGKIDIGDIQALFEDVQQTE